MRHIVIGLILLAMIGCARIHTPTPYPKSAVPEITHEQPGTIHR